MRFATVGTSWITDSFICALKGVDGACLYAVMSRSGERAREYAEKHSAAKYYVSLDDMLADGRIDAVYIANPNAMHYAAAKQCLLSGKHVLCEKPACTSLAETSELISLAKKQGVIFLEAMKSVHSPGLEIIKRNMEKIAPVRSAHIEFSQYSSKYDSYKSGALPNIFNPEMKTGALMDLGVYCVYAALELFSQPESVVSAASFLPSGADHSGGAVLSYKDKTVTLSYTKAANAAAPSVILGENGSITVSSVSKLAGIRINTRDGSDELLGMLGDEEAMRNQLPAFISYARGQAPDRYEYCCSLAEQAALIMEKIRAGRGFGF